MSGEYFAVPGSYVVILAGLSTLFIRMFCRDFRNGFSFSGVSVRDMEQYAAFVSSGISERPSSARSLAIYSCLCVGSIATFILSMGLFMRSVYRFYCD